MQSEWLLSLLAEYSKKVSLSLTVIHHYSLILLILSDIINTFDFFLCPTPLFLSDEPNNTVLTKLSSEGKYKLHLSFWAGDSKVFWVRQYRPALATACYAHLLYFLLLNLKPFSSSGGNKKTVYIRLVSTWICVLCHFGFGCRLRLSSPWETILVVAGFPFFPQI